MTGQPYFNILFPLSSQSPVASQVKPTKMSGSLCQAAHPTPKKTNNKKKDPFSLRDKKKKEGPDNKSFSPWPTASLLVRPMRSHYTKQYHRDMTSCCVATLCWLLLGLQQKKDQNRTSLGGPGEGMLATHSISTWGFRVRDQILCQISATLLNPVMLCQRAFHVLIIPWHFHYNHVSVASPL